MNIRSQAVVVATPWVIGAGNYLRLLSASLPVDIVFHRDGAEIARWDDVTSGTGGNIQDPQTGEVIKYTHATITTSADQTIKIAMGFGRIDSTASNVTVSNATVIDTVTDVALVAVTATQILPADSTRREALISNLDGAVNAIRVGDSNTGAARGAQVGAGRTITLQGTEAIFGYSVAGLSVGITVVKD